MKKTNLLLHSFLSSLGVFAYVAGVAWVMFNAQRLFGKVHSFIGPLMFLLLFVVSAIITGSLVLIKPIHMYMNDRKHESFRLLFYTAGWLILFTLLVFFV